MSRTLKELESQWSYHSVVASQLYACMRALRSYDVIGSSPASTGMFTHHLPADVTSFGCTRAPADTEDAASEDEDGVSSAPAASTSPPDLQMVAVASPMSTHAWMLAAGAPVVIDTEYPQSGTYTPLLSRPFART